MVFSLLFLLTCYTRNGLSAEAKIFPTKKKILPLKRCQMESAVHETLESILLLSSSTGRVKAVHEIHSFTGLISLRSLYLIKDF